MFQTAVCEAPLYQWFGRVRPIEQLPWGWWYSISGTKGSTGGKMQISKSANPKNSPNFSQMVCCRPCPIDWTRHRPPSSSMLMPLDELWGFVSNFLFCCSEGFSESNTSMIAWVHLNTGLGLKNSRIHRLTRQAVCFWSFDDTTSNNQAGSRAKATQQRGNAMYINLQTAADLCRSSRWCLPFAKKWGWKLVRDVVETDSAPCFSSILVIVYIYRYNIDSTSRYITLHPLHMGIYILTRLSRKGFAFAWRESRICLACGPGFCWDYVLLFTSS